MKIIIVANQKGGVGKTTLARHLAFFGAERGLRVLAGDFDVLGSFSETLDAVATANGRQGHLASGDANEHLVASGLFDVSDNRLPIQCADNMHYFPADSGLVTVERQDLRQVIGLGQAHFAKIADNYDICVLDTGPSVSNLLLVALSVADFAISPCKPDRDAIAGLGGFFSNIVRVRDETEINPRLSPLGVLPNQVDRNRAHHRTVLDQMRAAWGDVVLPVEMNDRAAIDTAKDSPVWRTTRGQGKSAAAREMYAVCAYIYARMGWEA